MINIGESSSKAAFTNDTIYSENLLLKSQLQELLILDETGIFSDLESLIKTILKKALILSKAEASFFALTKNTDPLDLEIRICNFILGEKIGRIKEKFCQDYSKWEETESVLVTIEDFIILPLVSRHKLLGILGLKLNNHAPENICEILPLLSRQSAVSLESAIFYERTFKRLLVLSNVFVLGKEIVSNVDLGELLGKFLKIARDGTKSELGVIFLIKSGETKPHYCKIQGVAENGKFEANLSEISPFIQQVCLEEKPIIVEDLQNSPFAATECPKFSGTILKNTIVVPLKARHQFMGVVQLANKLNRFPFIQEDLDFLNILCSQIAFVIQNTNLYNSLQAGYINTLKALTSAIDAKDSYTYGHSARVTEFAMELAREIGMDAKEMENLRVAGLLHDIGKIGISENILSKPSRLTNEEFEIVKTHPTLGVKILEGVEFLASVIPLIESHHERFDGKGYPHGISGNSIPLGARVIGVVDS
ncbi:HD domain-containing protein [bacterium]|nr:HD domain-containing protein [bacterium]